MCICQIVDLHKENYNHAWGAMKLAVLQSTFIALDLELSGLGSKRNLSSRSIDARYIEIVDAARTRSIISIGISCFKLQKNLDFDGEKYCVQTFNIFTLCSQPYVVEPDAVKFLIQHGFDFNKQYRSGIPYNKDNVEITDDSYRQPTLRLLFWLLTAANKPIILHNGLVDLAFIYQNLYLDLPSTLSMFVADVEDLFPAGIYDTKYLTEYHIRFQASYLQFVFTSCIKWNESTKQPIQFDFVRLNESEDVICIDLSAPEKAKQTPDTVTLVCQQFANHGWCEKSENCKLSHDINQIVHAESLPNKISKKKRRRDAKRLAKKLGRLAADRSEESSAPSSCDTADSDIESDNALIDQSANTTATDNSKSNCHRAGLDAFMTGVVFACFTKRIKGKTDMSSLKNRVHLSGKNIPLLVTKGNFGKVSAAHRSRCAELKAQIVL